MGFLIFQDKPPTLWGVLNFEYINNIKLNKTLLRKVKRNG